MWSMLLAFVALPILETGTGQDEFIDRVEWTTSRIRGTPDPPLPFAVEPAFPKLEFDKPVLITHTPTGDVLCVGEQGGRIYTFENTRSVAKKHLVADLSQPPIEAQALYGLAFDPDFERNRSVYLCYVVKGEPAHGTHVCRFRASSVNPLGLDLSSRELLITWRSGGHNGGCLKFGPDGCLYISTGDAERPAPPDILKAGQDVSNLLSAILRIDVNQSTGERPYSIPDDNPFTNLPGARGEIWAYGFRNPWRMSFDRRSGDLWVGDVGWELWEMIYKIEKGGNYGWSIMEGPQPVRPQGQRGPTPILPPTVEHPHSEAASITGGFVYWGNRIESLRGEYVYGDFQSGIIWSLKHDGEQVAHQRVLAETPLQLVAFGEDRAGELYMLDYDRSKKVYHLVVNPRKQTSTSFPTRLSESGLFESVAQHKPAPGVVAFQINASHWADGASFDRLMAIPGGGKIRLGKDSRWVLPDGSVIAKTVSMPFVRNGRAAKRRLETQLLHREAGTWRPYTYLWNDDQSDARLVDANGTNLALEIATPDGVEAYSYRVAARIECKLCHNPWVEHQTTVFGVQSASPLALTDQQMNRDGGDGNQIDWLRQRGFFATKPQSVAAIPRFVDPYHAEGKLEERVRSYLHVNCAHCHQFNAGGTANILLSHSVPLEHTRLLGERPVQGSFGITDARIIAPGDPFGSVLYYRLSKLGGGRMPRLGSARIDEKGLELLYHWIRELGNPESPRSDLQMLGRLGKQVDENGLRAAVAGMTKTTRQAMALAWELGRPAVSKELRARIVAVANQDSRPEVRELFERFVPESMRTKRLGDVFDVATVLKLKGNAEAGQTIFLSHPAAACKSCHVAEGGVPPVGPDLNGIGKKYSVEQLLSQILEPSRSMEPKYRPQIVETASGQIVTGLLVHNGELEIALRTTQNKVVRIQREEMEQMVPSTKSLMPELLLRDLTAQQVRDLLEYLRTL